MTALPLLDICLESNCAWARLLTHVCTRTHTRSDWLIDWLTGWLAGWLTDWLTPCLSPRGSRGGALAEGSCRGLSRTALADRLTRARVRGAWMAGGLVGNWVAGWCQHGPRMMILAKTRQNSTMSLMYVIVECFSPFGDVTEWWGALFALSKIASNKYWYGFGEDNRLVSGERRG